MNEGAFGIYDDGGRWSGYAQNMKAESSGHAASCSGYTSSTTSNMAEPYGTNQSELRSFSQLPEYQQYQIPYRQSNQYGDSYHSPVSYYSGVMDSQTTFDDFEAFTRERCHTWPGPRPPVADEGQQESTDEDNKHSNSPPALPSRGSSGLSLICESNESLAVSTSTPYTGDWNATNTGVNVGYLVRNQSSRMAVNQSLAQQSPASTATSVSPLPVTPSSNKRSTTTPSYKSGHPSYVELITQAILSSAEKRMTLAEIYDWMVANVPSFKDQRHLHSSAGWKNSVRHNLSLHARFKRVKRNGMDKPSWWTVDLSEEAKRERSKRPRQSRPRANTTTATSREAHNQRQQQRQAPIQGQQRPSIGFAQPHLPHLSDLASSGRGSLSFSGSMTPASSVGSDIFLVGTAGANSNVPMNPAQYGMSQQESLMPPPSNMMPGAYLSSPLDGSIAEDGMEWSQYATNAQSTPSVRVNDQLLDAVRNATEASSLHCLSQAITVSLQEPPVVSAEAPKQDITLSFMSSGSAKMDADTSGNYFGTNTGNVSNLVHAFRQNTLDESTGQASTAAYRQMLIIENGGSQAEEMNSPTRSSSHSPLVSCVRQQQQQFHQGLNITNSPQQQQLSPATGLQHQQMNSWSPSQYQYRSTQYVQNGGMKVSGTNGPLPDDLATLDVGGLDCNIMDVLSYEMNCNNTPKFA